jgi:integrase/recombinase XerD
MIISPEIGSSFVTPTKTRKPDKKLKEEMVGGIVRQLKKHNFDYDDLKYIFRQVRGELKVKRPKAKRSLPKVLSDVELRRFFQLIEDCGNIEHQIMLRLLFFTAIRVSELVDIKMGDVDLAQSKIRIDEGKGAVDRFVLFPHSFRLALSSHMENHPRHRYLFEGRQAGQYTTRRVQQIVEGYGKKAGIGIHCHLFRHQMLTWLTRNGLTDAQIQLISGHASKKSLEIYQHISLDDVAQDYQAAAQLAEASLNGRRS